MVLDFYTTNRMLVANQCHFCISNRKSKNPFLLLKEIFFIDLSHLNFLVLHNKSTPNDLTLKISTSNSLKLALLFYKNSSLLRFFILDFYGISVATGISLLYVLISPHCSLRVTLLCYKALSDSVLFSFSSIWASAIWMEREFAEFSEFYFYGLKDSRRLLLDYSIKKKREENSEGFYTNFNEVFTECVY